ncbi:hypothetical protein [Pseudomonas fluorescens]|uniref:hypothetical protein n=1 Tax=Pseudomonas fluorescens TaxID=294 RepID=UPI001780271F|nr:hypothetical protein [Pseudomonas fluorescens]
MWLKSSEYRGFSAFEVFGEFLSSKHFGIPGRIPDYQMLFSGYQNGAGGSPMPTNATHLSDRKLKVVKATGKDFVLSVGDDLQLTGLLYPRKQSSFSGLFAAL